MVKAKHDELIGNIEPVDVLLPEDDNAERRKFGEAVYKYVGKCVVCELPVYRWEKGPRNDGAIGNALACYVPTGPRNKPALYCQEHDPNIEQRTKTVLLPERDRPQIGDNWRPRAA